MEVEFEPDIVFPAPSYALDQTVDYRNSQQAEEVDAAGFKHEDATELQEIRTELEHVRARLALANEALAIARQTNKEPFECDENLDQREEWRRRRFGRQWYANQHPSQVFGIAVGLLLYV